MSLQVWLPMTKDLRQQGLSNVIATPSSGATYSSTGGKLGGCYTIAPTHGITLPASAMTSFTTGCSVAFWVKINSWKSSYDTFFQAGLSSTPWAHYRFGVLRYGSGSTLCFTITNSSGSSSSGSYVTSSLDTGVWYHLTFTYTAGKVSCYRNGILDKEYTTTIVPDFAGITNISIGRGTNGTSYSTDCNLNDFRIYNHCLSPMEVKQLAQGLVLHYPLNRQGWGQENLLNGTYDLSNWLMYGSCSIVADVGNQKKVKYNATAAWRGVWMSHCIDYQNVRNKTVTISGKFYAEEGASCVIGLTVFVCANAIQGTSSATERKYKDVAINFTGNGEWQTVSHTITITDSIFITGSFVPDFDNCYFSLYYSASSAGSAEYYGKNFKMEFGEKITPWCPNSSDTLATTMGLNGTTEYDCSGFCNNGTKNNSPTYSSDTAKYEVSTHVDGVNQTIQLPNLLTLIPDSIFTFNVWFKRLSTEPSSKPWETLFGGPSGFEIETCSANNVHDNKIKAYSWGGGTFEFELDKWNMLTMVSNGTNALFYLNSELKLTGTYKALVSGNYFLGSWSNTSTQNYKGYLSDARIYATALSAEEVLSLYQNSATIDSNGVIHGQIR